MPQVRRPIPSMLNGISQQPASLRHPSQCAALVNGFPSLATGLEKRAPTQHLAKITSASWGDAYSHVINWNANSQWLIVIRAKKLRRRQRVPIVSPAANRFISKCRDGRIRPWG